MKQEDREPTEVYFDLKQGYNSVSTGVAGPRDELLTVSGPLATSDQNEIEALDAAEGVKRITADEYKAADRAAAKKGAKS
jgi:hypothetical protein